MQQRTPSIPSIQQDVRNEGLHRWSSPPVRSRLVKWATVERYRFIRMLCALIVAVAFTVLSLGAVLPDTKRQNADLQAPLRFTSSGTFQISIFEDLHFGESIV